MEMDTVAYCGIEGSFASIAAHKIFPEATLQPYPSFDQAFAAVVDHSCRYAVLPIENSFAGDVSQVLDLLFRGPLFVSAVHNFRISQTLLGTQDSEIADIKTVLSHQQAIDQCYEFIKLHGFSVIPVTNTAVAAREISIKGDKSVAAIASEEAAGLYGLKILQKNINQAAENTTRFAVFTAEDSRREFPEKEYTSLLMFSVKNQPGALAKVINLIGRKGFNLIRLSSRPIKDVPWEYYFYVEVEGALSTPRGKRLLKGISRHTTYVKILGEVRKEQKI